MPINTYELAIRAEQRNSDSDDLGLFGHMRTKDFQGNDMTMAFSARRYAYVGSPLALEVWSADSKTMPVWEPYISLTSNIRPNECTPDEIIVKTHSENEHLREPLLALGYFKDTGKRIPANFVEVEIWQLTEKFVQAFNAAHPELQPA